MPALGMRSNLADRVACARRGWLAPVVVAKLDRLGRDHLHFISGLVAQKTPFLVADLGPDVEPFLLHLKAALTEKERAVISQRTKAALAAAKARGVELGGPTGLPPKVTPEQRAKGSAATAQLARDFAERLRPVLAGLDGQCGGPGVQAPRRQHGQWWRLVRGGGVICLAISRGVRGDRRDAPAWHRNDFWRSVAGTSGISQLSDARGRGC